MILISRVIHHRILKNIVPLIMLMAVIGIGLIPDDAGAQDNEDGKYDIGMRVGNLFEVEDVPISSMPMMSFYVRRELSNSWSAVLSLDSFVYDIDGTGEILGIPTVEESSSSGKMSLVCASIDHVFVQDPHGFQPYVQAGIGLGFTDFEDEDNFSSADPRYDIESDAKGDMDVVPTLSIGLRYATRSRWFFDAGARIDYHFNNLEVKDRVSGREVHFDNFYALGAYIGFGVKL